MSGGPFASEATETMVGSTKWQLGHEPIEPVDLRSHRTSCPRRRNRRGLYRRVGELTSGDVPSDRSTGPTSRGVILGIRRAKVDPSEAAELDFPPNGTRTSAGSARRPHAWRSNRRGREHVAKAAERLMATFSLRTGCGTRPRGSIGGRTSPFGDPCAVPRMQLGPMASGIHSSRLDPRNLHAIVPRGRMCGLWTRPDRFRAGSPRPCLDLPCGLHLS